ncbi:MAG: M55 family metallopeptidase [Planctomycetota bacterium]|jgi:D-amino peptidase
MKIYIAVDIEGASGYSWSEATSWLEEKGREYLTNDVNAAVTGAVDGGANEVIVADVHAKSYNLIYDKMHPKASIVYGVPHYAARFPFLDTSIDGMFLVAYHAMAGTECGTLEHTFSNDNWHKVEVNGQAVGEAEIDAAIAGESQVPVILVTGDDKVCTEARNFFGDIETAIVKIGVGRARALCFSIEETYKRIYEAAKRSMERIGNIKPFCFETPVEVRITHKHTQSADNFPSNPINFNGSIIRRVDAYTTVQSFSKISDWFGGIGNEKK